MGLAASQARLISLTARMSDLEYEGQQINQQRQVLTNKMTEVYNQAMAMEVPTPPSKIDFAHEAYTSTNGKVVFEKDEFGQFTGYEKRQGTAIEPYNTPEKNDVSVTELLGKDNFDITPDENGDYSFTTLEALKLGFIQKNDIGNKESSVYEGVILVDGKWSVSSDVFHQEVAKNKTFDTVGGDVALSIDNADAYIKSLDSAKSKELTEAIDGFKKYIGGGFDEEKCQVIIDNSGNISFLYKDLPNGVAAAMKDNALRYVVTADPNAKVPVSNIQASYDGNGQVAGFIYTDADNNTRSVQVEQSGDYYNEPKYEAAMRQYNRDKIEYDQKQNEYNKQTSIYQRQDKQLELKLTRLDNERNALNTEIESVKKVIQDANEKGFKTFSG